MFAGRLVLNEAEGRTRNQPRGAGCERRTRIALRPPPRQYIDEMNRAYARQAWSTSADEVMGAMRCGAGMRQRAA